jgi:hypothetical protein
VLALGQEEYVALPPLRVLHIRLPSGMLLNCMLQHDMNAKENMPQKHRDLLLTEVVL